MPTDRIKKVNSLLEKEISKMIQKEIIFPNVVLVTLTYVDTTANLVEAKVFISAIPDARISQVVEILNKEVYNIQQKLNRMLNMRPIPKIRFVADKTESEAGRVEELLNELKKREK